MMKSQKEFKSKLLNLYLDLHWRQWEALGVSSQVSEEDKWIIDLESLIITTLFTGKYDRRLLFASLEWIIKYGNWVSSSRFKRIAGFYKKNFPGFKICQDALKILETIIKSSVRVKTANNILEEIWSESDHIFSGFKNRGIISEPVPQKDSLLQLSLRGVFGINARAEILLYLLTNEKGNSNQIANEIYYSQRIVYRVLENWVKAGLLEKEEKSKEGIYFLSSREEIIETFTAGEISNYLNWPRIFLFLGKILNVLDDEKYFNDRYLLASFFRELSGEAKSLGNYFNVKFPEEKLNKGEDFYQPFSTKVLELLKII